MNDGQNPAADPSKVPTLIAPSPKNSPEVNKSNKIAMSPREKRERSLSENFDEQERNGEGFFILMGRSRSATLSPGASQLKPLPRTTPSAPPTTPELSHEDVSPLDTVRVEHSPNTLRKLGFS